MQEKKQEEEKAECLVVVEKSRFELGIGYGFESGGSETLAVKNLCPCRVATITTFYL